MNHPGYYVAPDGKPEELPEDFRRIADRLGFTDLPPHVAVIDELFRKRTAEAARSQMEQGERFLAAHLDLRETHLFCFFPCRHRSDHGVIFRLQPVALIPVTRLGEAWPWERVQAEEMPHQVLRVAIGPDLAWGPQKDATGPWDGG